jgi:CRISPR-associated protein Cmr4
MKRLLVGLLAETPLHCGIGQSDGIVDLPVAREAATDYPVITGSSLKGGLKNHAQDNGVDSTDIEFVFGREDGAGALLVSEARLLLLPVRSLSSAYKWVTCPHLIERFVRDAERVHYGIQTLNDINIKVDVGEYIGSASTDNTLFLEEMGFEHTTVGVIDKVASALKRLILHKETQERLQSQLVILNDNDFMWFAKNGLGIQARNVLEAGTKESKNVWYEEYLPADTLLYTTLFERISSQNSNTNAVECVKKLLVEHPYLRVGGNETVGMGWLVSSIVSEEETQ